MPCSALHDTHARFEGMCGAFVTALQQPRGRTLWSEEDGISTLRTYRARYRCRTGAWSASHPHRPPARHVQNGGKSTSLVSFKLLACLQGVRYLPIADASRWPPARVVPHGEDDDEAKKGRQHDNALAPVTRGQAKEA